MHTGWGLLVLVLSLVAGCGDDNGGGPGPSDDAGPPPDVPSPMRDCAEDPECDDGIFCNGAEQCIAGRCEPGTTPDCDDTMPCTIDRCSEEDRACVHGAPDADFDGHETIECGGDDCDDTDPNRFPGNDEVCDEPGHDEDCDSRSVGDRDEDRDGYIDALCCNAVGMVMPTCGTDCNDLDPGSHPSEGEVCDGADNDCDGTADDGVEVMGFADADRDLHGDPAMPIRGCAGRAGFSTTDDDCDDGNAAIHGAQPELCDGIDNDCDTRMDEGTRAVTWYRDTDGDGFGSPESGTRISCEPVAGHSVLGTDCDDSARGVSPVAAEQCNGGDDDCNGVADFVIGPGNFEDDDGDGAADMACPRLGTDCDDHDPTTFRGAMEQCDGRDNDCDGMADGGGAMAMWFPDADGDGYGNSAELPIVTCEPQVGRSPVGGDCDDSDPALHPGAADSCDGRDEDCDGDIDETAFRTAFYRDADGDGVGGGTAVFACAAPAGHLAAAGDCNDADASAYPGAMETCDGADDDCDGTIDDGAFNVYHPDADGDGFGVSGGMTRMACTPPAGFGVAGDCDDANPARYPMAAERCNRVDDDCDGTVDDGAETSCMLANATATCTGGVCRVASCTATRFQDCDGLAANGCEADTDYSPLTCGGCTTRCPVGDSCGQTGATGRCDSAPVVSLRASANGSYGLRATGGGGVWGDARNGVLGDGGTGVREVPALAQRDDLVQVALAQDHGCGVLVDGRVACWGLNDVGQLGDGTTTPRLGGVIVPSLPSVVDVGVGLSHSCAVRSDGTIACWGGNLEGGLGHGATGGRLLPTPVMGITNAVEVEGFGNSTCARHADGRVSCWGRCAEGQCADGAPGPQRFAPFTIPGISDATALAHSNGVGLHMCAIRRAGSVLCWGSNAFGQIGNGAATMREVMPATVATIGSVLEVAVGTDATCSRDAMFRLHCWGNNDSGQVGAGSIGGTFRTPQLNASFSATGVSVGTDHSCVLTPTPYIWCAGADNLGQHGTGVGDSGPSGHVLVPGIP